MGLTVNFRSGSNGPLELRLSELVAESTERSRNDGMIGGPPERLRLRDGRDRRRAPTRAVRPPIARGRDHPTIRRVAVPAVRHSQAVVELAAAVADE